MKSRFSSRALFTPKQEWKIGATVKVGFLSLVITGKIPTPGDGRPDMWTLESMTGTRYTFTPYYGLEKTRTGGAL